MRHNRLLHTLRMAALSIVTLAIGCGVSSSGLGFGSRDPINTEDASAAGGTMGSSDVTGNGGSRITSGLSDTGGSTVAGDGGIGGHPVSSGGIASAGGTIGGGGVSPLGGNLGTAGTSGQPDTSVADYGQDLSSASGGITANGGATGTGGAAANGGAIASGGATANGGATGTGGTTASGGAIASGGATANGGATGTDGATEPVTLGCPAAAPAGVSPNWCSCDLWGHTTKGDATYYNNVWGLGAAGQCIWVSGSQWGTTTNQPNTAGVKSYPNISLSPGKAISALNTYTSSFDITVPSGGAWAAAYDIRLKKNLSQLEVMVWVNYTQGNVLPISSTPAPVIPNVTIGGHAWNAYFGQAGEPGVISLLRTTNTNSATVDIKAILNWLIVNQGSFNSSWTLDQVQFGFEIVSDGSVQSFTCNSFSTTSS
jgi:hypothetical protein